MKTRTNKPGSKYMISKKYFSRLLSIVAIVALALPLAPATVVAQDDGSGYTQVRTMIVKGGQIPAYLELQRQFARAEKAADRSRNFWQEIRGDTSTFYAVRSLDRLGDNDAAFQPAMEQDDWDKWIAAFGDTVASSTYAILRNYPELQIPADEGTELNMLYLRERNVAPGKSDEYHDWIQNRLMPALRKGGVKGFGYSRVAMGGNNNTWIGTTRLENWSALDGPGPFTDMDADEIEAMLAAGNALLVSSENRILRYRADLSY